MANPFVPNCRRLLSIDGGGLCGLIPAEALIAIEKQLDQLTGDPQRLCNRFDLIGGTSTGAILAAGIAKGLSATELRDFYINFGPKIFKKVFLPAQFWHKYPSGPIEQHLREVLGADTTLDSNLLKTMILLTVKNATLDSDWFFTNNPNNRFFATNRKLRLWEIVRSSSAAPTYFPPHTMAIPGPGGQAQDYEFIDGGVSSYNNPSLQVFLEATVPEYGIGWPMGVNNLLLISLGTGFCPVTIEEGKAAHYNLVCWAQYVLKELMNEANLEQNMLMRLISERPPQPAVDAANSALRAAVGAPSDIALDRLSAGLATTKLLTYQRVTVGLTRERLDQLKLPDIDPVKVREMDAVDQIENMRRVGEAVAAEQVHMERLAHFFKG